MQAVKDIKGFVSVKNNDTRPLKKQLPTLTVGLSTSILSHKSPLPPIQSKANNSNLLSNFPGNRDGMPEVETSLSSSSSADTTSNQNLFQTSLSHSSPRSSADSTSAIVQSAVTANQPMVC